MADEALIAALETARQRMIDENGAPVIEGWNRKILYHFPDVEEYWVMEVKEGMPEAPVQGEIFDADIRIRMSSDTFIGLMNGAISGLKAMTTGKVRVKASMADMKELQVFM